MSHDVLTLENQADSTPVAGTRVTVYVIPMKTMKGEIAPDVVVARVKRRKTSNEGRVNLYNAVGEDRLTI